MLRNILFNRTNWSLNILSLLKPRELIPSQGQMLKHFIQGFRTDSKNINT